jgi:voltage-gated sodium channel
LLDWVDFLALLVFTVEAAIGIVAAGERPSRYFGDRWSQFDFLIVCNGWLDLLRVFQSDFLVVFRLLRLLRVFRLARAFPKLRSIVNSLLSALTSVGWIAILMLVFNYIASVVAMLLFQRHDPFFYGSMLQALFTTFILSTQDLWDVVMRINVWGCADFPKQLGYPLTLDGDFACDHPRAFGYLGVLYFLVVVVVGSLILPTMLIGVVAINFEESSTQFSNELSDRKTSKAHLEVLKKDMGGFFDDERIRIWESIFKYLDVDGQGRLDLNEITPLVLYLAREHLGHAIAPDEVENVVLFFDDDDTGDLNFGELMTLVRYVVKARDNPTAWADHLARPSLPPLPPPTTSLSEEEEEEEEDAQHPSFFHSSAANAPLVDSADDRKSSFSKAPPVDDGAPRSLPRHPLPKDLQLPPLPLHNLTPPLLHENNARSPLMLASPLPSTAAQMVQQRRIEALGFHSLDDLLDALGAPPCDPHPRCSQ